MIYKSTSLFLLVFFFFIVLVEAGKDYYAILDLPRDAPKTQIKKHFKKLSRVYHPDKNPGDDTAQEKFMAIAEGRGLFLGIGKRNSIIDSFLNVAYEILSDDEKRQIFDRYGEEGLKQQQQQGGGGHHPFGNLFNQFFGGGGNKMIKMSCS